MVEEAIKELEETRELIKAGAYNIKDYFKIYNKLVIPMYQRSYSWEEKNMCTFIKDIYTHKDYYIGNVMVIENKNNNDVEVIDGQQRLISIFLILSSLKNEYGLNVEKRIEMLNGNKILVENRAPASMSQILRTVYDNSVPDIYYKKNEYIIYKKIKKIITDNNLEPIKLFNNILNLKIVEIKFLSPQTKAHDTFVNLNTKGKALEDIDIVKSRFFSLLITNDKVATKYKENWYFMLELIGDKHHQKYFDTFVDICLPSKNKKTKRLDIFLNELNSRDSATNLYNLFVSNNKEQNCFCKSAGAIFNHNLELIRDNIDDSNYSFDDLNSIIKLYDKAKFKQFDIVLISLLYFKDKKSKRQFINNFQYIKKFLLFVLMHQTILSINKTSPSTYGNSFKDIAQKIYSGKDITEVGKEFINHNLKVLSKNEIIDSIKSAEIRDNTYQAKLVIQLVNNDFTSDLIIEHFAKQSGTYANRFKIGNCIPISQDNFGEIEIEEKIEKYKSIQEQEKYVKELLNENINEQNCDDIITSRTNSYAKRFAEKYENLKKELL